MKKREKTNKRRKKSITNMDWKSVSNVEGGIDHFISIK